ncbi:MAG: hypothetical protein ACE5G7_05580 [Candidatus Hydrothermarchaeaceae archaeon]
MLVEIDCRFMEVVQLEDYSYLNCNLRNTTSFSCPSCNEGLVTRKK